MNEIEFLPKRFRERQRRSNIEVSRWLILSLFLGAMALVSLYQFAELHHANGQLANLKSQHERIAQLLQEMDQSRSKAIQMRHHARLLTFLDHPYPKTQILAAVTNPLPNEIVITRIELTHPQLVKDAGLPLSEKASDQSPQGHAMELDLKQLISESRSHQCTVEIEGMTSDSSSLYTFLAALHESDIIRSAKIESIDPQIDSNGQEISNFTAHVNVERGHFHQFNTALVGAVEAMNRGGDRQ